MSETPLVSAIVSAYKSERLLGGCLQDLEDQTIASKLEIVVVNSGSPQDERSVVKRFQEKYDNIVYIETPRRETIYKAWNRAIEAAKGKYITNANTDDRHKTDALEVMVDYLERYPEIDLVYARQWVSNRANEPYADFLPLDPANWPPEYRERLTALLKGVDIRPVEKEGKTGYILNLPEFTLPLLKERGIIGPQPMWRRTVHERIGYFDHCYESIGDYEYWLRMALNGSRFRLLPEVLGVFYISGTNMELRQDARRMQDDVRVFEKYFFDFSKVTGETGKEAINDHGNREISRSIREYPRHFLKYCHQLSRLGRKEELWAILTKVGDIVEIEVPPEENSTFYLQLGGIYKEAGLRERAWEILEIAARHNRDERELEEIYFHRGDLLKDTDPVRSEIYIRKALEMLEKRRDKNERDIYRQASIYKRLNDMEQAKMLFTQLVETAHRPEIVGGANYHLGEMAQAEDDVPAALEYFRKCLEAIPGHSGAAKFRRELIREDEPVDCH